MSMVVTGVRKTKRKKKTVLPEFSGVF